MFVCLYVQLSSEETRQSMAASHRRLILSYSHISSNHTCVVPLAVFHFTIGCSRDMKYLQMYAVNAVYFFRAGALSRQRRLRVLDFILDFTLNVQSFYIEGVLHGLLDKVSQLGNVL